MKKKMLFVDNDKYEEAKEALRKAGLNWYNQTSTFYVHGLSVAITVLALMAIGIAGKSLHLF